MTLPARLVALAVAGALVLAGAALLGGAGRTPAPSVVPTFSAAAVASPVISDLVMFKSPRYGYSVAIDVEWHIRPATDQWLGSEPPHQSDPPFADRFDGAGSSAGRTVLIKARQLPTGTTSAAWMAQWEQTREVLGQCFGSATRWMDWTVAGVHARRLAWRCDSAASEGANYDEYTVVASGKAFVITGSPAMVVAVLGSIQLPD